MSPRVRRVVVPLLWSALVLPGSGCLTQALWKVDAPVCRVALSEHAVDAEIVVTADGNLEGALQLDVRRDGELAPPDASGMGDRSSFWRLRPAHGGGGAAAVALLEGRAAFAVDAVEVRAVREVAEGRVTVNQAELWIRGRGDESSLATPVEASALPTAALASLRRVGGSDLLLDNTLPSDPPELLVECARRLRALDPRVWLPGGESGHARVAGCVWLDGDCREVLDGARAGELVGWFAVSDRSLARRLEALRSLRVLVAVAGRGTAELFVLRPDLVWLWSELDASSGGQLHCSTWWAEPVAAAYAAEPATVLARGSMHLEFLTARYESPVARYVAGKTLLTPFTYSIDAVAAIGRWMIEDPGHAAEFIIQVASRHYR